jgi:hypothetical protein
MGQQAYVVHYKVSEIKLRGHSVAPVESTVLLSDAEGRMDAIAIAAASLAEGGLAIGRDEQITFTVEGR